MGNKEEEIRNEKLIGRLWKTVYYIALLTSNTGNKNYKGVVGVVNQQLHYENLSNY